MFLWQPVDLSSIATEKRMSVQILHNNTHQDPLWKHQLIPRTCINLLLYVGTAWQFEFSMNLLDQRKMKQEFDQSKKRMTDKFLYNLDAHNYPVPEDEFDDAEEKVRHDQIDTNNVFDNDRNVPPPICALMDTSISNFIRIVNQQKT